MTCNHLPPYGPSYLWVEIELTGQLEHPGPELVLFQLHTHTHAHLLLRAMLIAERFDQVFPFSGSTRPDSDTP